MKKILIALSSLLLSASLQATTLNKGDIIVIGFNVTNNSQNWITFLSRTTIPAGTVIYVTNDRFTGYSLGNATFTAGSGGTRNLKITLTEELLAGQTFKVFKNGSITYSSHGNSTATGTIDIDNSNDVRVLWIYQEVNNIKNVITGVAWNWGSGSGNSVDDIHTAATTANGFIWTHTSNSNSAVDPNANSLNLNIPGASSKCGSWNPFSSGTTYRTAINLSSNITSTGSFYNIASWTFGNSNGGWNTCDLSVVDANVVNGYLAEHMVRSDVYKKTCAGWFYSSNGGTSFAADNNTTIWPSNAATAEVRIECDHTLSGTSYDTYSCFKLVVGSGANSGGVTLTVDPGNNILFSQSLVFNQSSNNVRPILRLRSGVVSNVVRYATILPSSAPFNDLDGDLSYELYIKHAGWHHLQSPILSKLQDIAVRTTLDGTPVDLSGTSFFTSTSAAQYTTSRVWSWDGVAQQWINQAANTATADFNSQPYTIFVHPDEIPLTFTVTGLIPSTLRDQTNLVNLTSSSATSSVGLGNVPWVRTGTTLQGNNLYGNPYLSFIDSRALLENYITTGRSTSNRMSNLNDYLLVWDPSLGTSANIYNGSSQYLELSCSFSGNTASFSTTSSKTSYLSPFQAFVMKSSNGGANGFVESRRYRIGSSANTENNTVVNKAKASTDQKSLNIYRMDNDLLSSINIGAYFNSDRRYKEHSDVRARQSDAGYIGAYVDSMLLSTMFWPTQDDTASINILHSSLNNGEIFKFQTEDQEGSIFDRRNKTLHNLKYGEYSFTHDTTWNNIPRYKWYFNSQAVLSDAELAPKNEIVAYYGNGKIHLVSDFNGSGQIYSSSGQLVQNIEFIDGNTSINIHELSKGIYFATIQGVFTKFIVQ